MNVAELARILKVGTRDLLETLPKLGFDLGKKSIKVNDKMAQQIIVAWREYDRKMRQEEQYLKGKDKDAAKDEEPKGEVEIPPVLTVRDFSKILNLPVTGVISELMKNGVMASVNQRIDFDTAAIMAEELGYTPILKDEDAGVELNQDLKLKNIFEKEKESLESRAPVIVVMGHVDHGKTKLLDAIRKTHVMEGEAGGITQHIGAYQVNKKGRQITFIDTPGHEAFTAMRSRGAKIADIAILVIAADDGIKPQTVEAIKIAQEAGLTIVVAINKIDKPGANVEKVKQDLTKYNLLPEEWGGKIIVAPVSAKNNIGIDELLDKILFVADLEADKIRANPSGEFVGSIIESHIDKNMGPVATVLIKNGTLKKGENLSIDGAYFGKVRAMKNYNGKDADLAGPSMPVQIVGFKVAPKVGDIVEAVMDLKKSKRKADYFKLSKQEEFVHMPSQEEDDSTSNVTKLNVVIKADVLGSEEAVIESLQKIENKEIKIDFVQKGLGNITESDVLAAEASGAMLLGFNVRPTAEAELLARDKGVEIKIYKIIYELIDEVKNKLNEIVKPEIVRENLGKMEVLALFKKTDKGQIVGGKVISGKIEAGSSAAVFRKDEFVGLGKISQLQAGKQEVADVPAGQEAGIQFEGQTPIEVGDVLDVYREIEKKKVI
ncbi:MAG TPA: translation initiation factor IF-2 [Candidatus Bipolaricaulota bacterium]|nr:translation initiation factor IF-2 [Candidatus Bipolaricaulota bacterium]